MPDELDAWKCPDCDGEGLIRLEREGVDWRDIVITKEHCDACDGIGWQGPDATRAAEQGVVTEPAVALWQAMNKAEKVGNRTDDKLIVEFLRRAGYCIAPVAATPAPQAQAAGQELPPLPLVIISAECPAWNADQMRDYARAAVSAANSLAQRQPLTDEQALKAMTRVFGLPLSADLVLVRRIARSFEAACAEAWGVKLGATTGEQHG